METLKTRSAGGIVVNCGKVIVVSQKGVSWALPKGHIEGNEEKLDAAKREIHEETGVKNLTLIKELGTYKRYKMNPDGTEDKSELKEITFFLFKTDEIKLKPIDPDNPEAKWVEIDEVAKVLTHKKDREFYSKSIEEIKKLK